MISTVPVKIVATTVALLIAGAAAAAAAMDSPPPAADKGLTNAEEHTGFPVPVANGRGDDEAPGDDDAVEDEGDESEEAPDEATDEADDESADDAAPKDNHGAYVSAVAHDKTLTGREHGKAVSEVARSDAGKPDHGDDEDDADDSPGQGNGQGQGQGNGQGNGQNK